MPTLKLRRIDLSAPNAAAQLTKLRDQFRTDSEIVSPASKKLTQAVFGEGAAKAAANGVGHSRRRRRMAGQGGDGR